MAVIDLIAIGRTLNSLGFEATRISGHEWVCVRPSVDASLFERIELLVPDRAPVLMLNVAVSVIRDIRLNFRGLTVRGDLEELCDEPENGRVHGLEDTRRLAVWLKSLETVAPRRAREHCAEKGPGLLEATFEIRAAATKALKQVLAAGGPSQEAVSALLTTATPDEEASVSRVLKRQQVQPDPTLEEVFRVAILALLRTEDGSVMSLASSSPPRPTLQARSLLPHQTIRVVADFMLRGLAPEGLK